MRLDGRMRIFFRPLSVLLSGILAVGSCLEAQNITPADSSDVQELHIRVVEGTGASGGSIRPLTVTVTDGRGSAVSNATVLFRLPSDVPTGLFSDGSRVAVLYTDLEGHASVKNIQWGASSGTAVIRVTASKGTTHAGLLVEQVLGPSKTSAALTPPPAPSTLNADPTVSTAPTVSTVPAPEAANIVHPAPVGEPAPVGQPAHSPAERSSKPILISAQGATLPSSTTSEEPTVQITSNRPVQLTGASGKSKKWLWIGIGSAAAAGMAFAFVGKGSGSSSSQTPGSPSLSIGTPSVSIGHP
jgi:hypothetical protein